MLADQAIRLGEAGVVVAGGMESMSRAPYLLTRAREGYRLGHGELIDAMIHRRPLGRLRPEAHGDVRRRVRSRFGFSREEQDDFAVRSFTRARQAIADGIYRDEIVPVEVGSRGKTTVVSEDEGPSKFDEAKLRALKPAFGTDGPPPSRPATRRASATARRRSCSSRMPSASGWTSARWPESSGPRRTARSPNGSPPRRSTRSGSCSTASAGRVDEVDLFEINEAFAVVAMVAARELAIPAEKLNIYGGAVALGHPIGCSGARILVTLLHALKRTGGRRGVASLCIGGGEAVAVAVEATGL